MKKIWCGILCCFAIGAAKGQVTEWNIQAKSGDDLISGVVIADTAASKLPAIIFCVGSGPSSYRTNYRRFLEYYFQSALPLDSVALVYFDKRGMGASTGHWSRCNFNDRAEDVKIVAETISQLPFIDTERIALAGHSQGGWIVQLALAKYPSLFRCGLSLAGPTFSVHKQVVNDYTSRIMCKRGVDRETAYPIAEKQVRRDIFLASAFPVNAAFRQLKRIKDFDPAKVLAFIHKPLDLVFAANDPLVYPDWCHESLDKIFTAGVPKNIMTYTVPSTDHNFKLADLCANNSAGFSPELRAYITRWAQEKLLQ